MPGKRRKSRNFVISFGDIMLPLIGVVAIGLLLLAGRFFFTSDFHSDRDALPVMAQQRERPAQAKERAAVPARSRTGEAAPVLTVPDIVLAVPYEEKKSSVSPERSAPPISSSSSAQPSKPAGGSVSSTHPKPRPALPPKPKSAQTPAPAKKPASPVKNSAPSQKIRNSSGWMVQVGAFSMKSAADDTARQLLKEGHSAEVVSGKTIHRVLIHASGKDDASTLAARMDRSGFPGAFVISPKQ